MKWHCLQKFNSLVDLSLTVARATTKSNRTGFDKFYEKERIGILLIKKVFMRLQPTDHNKIFKKVKKKNISQIYLHDT